MKKLSLLFVLLFSISLMYAQKVSFFDYDPCSEDITKGQKKQFQKALSLFQDRKYQKSSLILTDMIRKDEAFASVYFIMGMIGVNNDNPTMIRKYFPLCEETCKDFSHPLLWYYLGIINYSDENYIKAQEDFQNFMTLSEEYDEYDSLRSSAINYLNWSDFLYKATANPVSFNPKRIEYLAEKSNYFEPFITADSSEIYFIREEFVMDTVKDSFLSSSTLKKEIKSGKATLDTDFYYDRGLILPTPFNVAKKESRVSTTADNNLLFFSVQNKKSWDIVYCERYGDYWSEARPININTEEFDELQPFVTWDGNSLFFVSNRKGGKGRMDIWLTNRIDKDTWSEPRNLGSAINTPFDETFPFLSFDDEVLYFISNGHKTIGGTDIFYKKLTKEEQPKNIGYPINTEGYESNIGVMLDGKTAYTTLQLEKDRHSSIVTFILPKEATSERCKLVKGVVNFDVETNITLDLFNVTKNNFHNIGVSPNNPTFSLVLQEENNYFLTFNKIGYMFSATKIENADSLSVYVKPVESGQVMLLDNINLNQSNTDFTQETYISIINPFLNFISNNAHARINIYSEEKILKVLEKHLLNKGIRKDRFELIKSKSNNIFYEIQ